jgi:hypothetical protein
MKDLQTTMEVHNIYDIFMTMWDAIFNHTDYRNELPLSPDCCSLVKTSFCGHAFGQTCNSDTKDVAQGKRTRFKE